MADGAIANSFSPSSANALNTVLAEEANRIGSDIHKNLLHTSPWIDLVKKTTFPDQMGYNLTTLIYDRALPTKAADGAALIDAASWKSIALDDRGTTTFGTSKRQGQEDLVDYAMNQENTPINHTSYASVSRQLKQYSLKKLSIESPRVSLEDLRFAAHRSEQLRSIIDLLSRSAKHTWETRYRDEFERLAANLVICETAGSTIKTLVDSTNADNTTVDNTFEGMYIVGSTTDDTTNVENSSSTVANVATNMANVSNAILDKIYFNLVRKGGGNNAYGRENGRPIFGIVLSSEASYQLQTEAGFRDDVRYNNAAVSDLIAPLGVEKSFRGFYHLVDDMAPRFTIDSSGIPTAVPPYNVAAGIVSMNGDYDTAGYEAAYVIHPEVYEALIPSPLSGASGGISFDPVNYKGDFKWTNIPDATNNPDGTIGYFRGILSSASKPIKTDFGFVILFKRDSSAPAA